MARTKRKNLAAIAIQPDQGEQEAVDDDDENVEVRKQRVLIVIPSMPQPSNDKNCKQTSSPPQPQIKALPAPRPRPPPPPLAVAGSTTVHKKNLQEQLKQQQLKLLLAPRDIKIGSFKKKLQRIGGLGLWLRSQGLGQFARIFQEQQMDEADLLNLTMQVLKDIGVAPVGPRRKLIWAIDQLCNG